jgi:hypothetical protein
MSKYSLVISEAAIVTEFNNIRQGEEGTKLNSVAWVRERTIPTERQPLVSEVSATLWGQKVTRGKRDESLRH